MTDEEKRDRIKSLNYRIDALREERDEYKKQLEAEKKNKDLEDRKKYVGKYFVYNECRVRGGKSNDIKAFKVLKVIDEYSATCLILCNCINDCSNFIDKASIKIANVGLWTYNVMRLMNTTGDPLVIDYFTEISKEEFKTMYDEHENILRSYL